MTVALFLSLAALAQPLLAAHAKQKTPGEMLVESLFDPAAFGAKLPKQTLIFATSSRNSWEVQDGIKALGPVNGVDFFRLPAGAEPPVIIEQPQPVFPRDAASGGQACLLALIDASGKVSALYCIRATQRSIAVSAAAAVARWRFKPAMVQKHAVPVMFAQTLNFDVETRF